MSKLTSGQRQLMTLALRDANSQGWTKVSELVWPLVSTIPEEILYRYRLEDGGKVRLTFAGQMILKYT